MDSDGGIGGTFRQRIHLDGAHVELWDSKRKEEFKCLYRNPKLEFCEHRVTVAGILYRPGIRVNLTDGFTSTGTEYRIKVEEVSNSQVKVEPKCIRGAPFDRGLKDWSKAQATACLQSEAYLQKTRISRVSALKPRYIQHINSFNDKQALATLVKGIDGLPVCHPGEPPLRETHGDDQFRWYLEADPEEYTKIKNKYKTGAEEGYDFSYHSGMGSGESSSGIDSDTDQECEPSSAKRARCDL